MNKTILLITALFLLTLQHHVSYSQNEKVSPTFKITGKTKVATLQGEKTVEYVFESADHLYISDFDKNGVIQSKRQFLFKGKRFDLENLITYYREKVLQPDGVQIDYLTDGTIGNEDIIREGKLIQRTIFYPDGNRKLLFSGEENILNGEYKIWFPNGQLNFSGNYKSNLKEGEFQQFDQSGTLIKKGVYLDGKLISGEPVVQDVIFYNPEKTAQYINGNAGFDDFIKRRSTEIEGLKEIKVEKKINLNLVVGKTGSITKIETLSALSTSELEILNAVFKELPDFTPATVEEIPVESILKLNLILSKDGIKTNIDETGNGSNTGIIPEKMPQFPGGGEALRKFISFHLKYPVEAQKAHIEGKVFVNFIVNENGEVTNIKIARGVNPDLNSEAMRVVGLMPNWTPGQQKGKAVKVNYTVPIGFSLR